MSRPLNRGGIADLPLLRTLLGIRQGSDTLLFFTYPGLAASRTLLQPLLAYLNFALDSEDLFCWYKRKKWFLWTMAGAQGTENHEDEWGLTWYLRWGIYTSIPTWIHSQNSLARAEALSLKISSHETLSNDHEDTPSQLEDCHKLCNETRHPVLSLIESQWKPRQ